MGITVLGPLAVDGNATRLAPRDRVVLAALALAPGRLVGAEQLADALWPEDPPASWHKIVQGSIVRLRKALGPEAIQTLPGGYRLAVPAGEVDAHEFQRLVRRAREQLSLGAPERAAYTLDEALALWRGRALLDLDGWDTGRIEARRLDEMRRDAEELRIEAALRAGRHRDVLAEAQALSEAAPLRERRWELLALAQYQAGRQADALRTLRRASKVLLDELGLDPGHDLVALEQAILRQDPALDGGLTAEEPSAVCPYLGLVPYDVEDAEAFFGRESDVGACVRRIATAGVVAVVGPSGCGKSSLVRAGLAAALRRDGVRVTVVTPGAHPLECLTGIASPGTATVLVVDQCEEAVTLCHDHLEQVRFFAALSAYAESGRLVIAVRADRLGDLAALTDFTPLVERGLYLLGPMSEEGLRSAIEGPARRAGLRLEPGLVELLMREVHGEPGALPLLSHALRQTWARREGSTLTVEGYRATGGIRGAVAQSAESLYEQLPADDRPVLRDLLLRLVVPNPKGEPVPVRVARRLVATDPRREHLVELLVAARLVTSDDGELELAHEALARAWPRLRGWLDDDAEGQRILRHLTVAADSWHSMGRPTSELYRGTRLAQVLDWRHRDRPDITPTEQAFVDAGRRLAEAEERSAAQQARAQARTNRRLRGMLGGVAFLLLAAVVAGTLAVRQANRAADASTVADARRVAAQAQLTDQLDVSLLLATAAWQLDPSASSRTSLLAALSRSPGLTAFAPAPEQPFWHLDVSPDGGTVAVMDLGARVRFFDTGRLETTGTFDPHPPGWDASVACVCDTVTYSPDGRTVAVSIPTLAYPPVRMVDPRSQRPDDLQLGGQPRSALATSMDFSADGRLLAVAFELFDDEAARWLDPALYVWDLSDPARPARRIGLRTDTEHVEISPDGRLLYSVPQANSDLPDRPGRVFEVASGNRVRGLGDLGHGLTLSPDGSTIAYADGPEVVLAESSTGATVRRLIGPQGNVDQVDFSSDGRLVGAVTDDRTATVWETASGAVRERFPLGAGDFAELRFSADDRRLYVGVDGGLLAFDLTGGDRYIRRRAPMDTVPSPDGTTSRYPSPAGDALVIQRWDPTTQVPRVRLLDLETGRSVGIAGEGWIGTGPGGAAWSPDGQQVAIIEGEQGLRVVDRTGEVLARRALETSRVEYSDDGSRLLAQVEDGAVLLDAASLDTVSEPVAVAGRNTAAATLGPDGKAVLLTADEPRSAFDFTQTRAWALVDLGTGELVRDGDLAGPTDSFVVSPDGRRLAVAGRWGAEVVDLASGASHTSMSLGANPGGEVVHLSYSPDASLLVSSDNTGRVSLWDGSTAVLLGTVGPSDTASSPVFLRDSRTVLIPAWDGGLYEWDTSVDHAVAFACRIVGRGLDRAEWESVVPGEPYRDACPA